MSETKMDLSKYSSRFSTSNKLGRVVWNICYWILFRPFGTKFFQSWRNFVLRIFGAKLSSQVIIYSSVKIWAPWNLEMGENSCLGPNVDCYNQGKISIGSNTVISQKSSLCASTHDYSQSDFPLICKPIVIGEMVWIAAEAFVGPGVNIGDGAVIGARSAIFKNIDSWTVVGGNPAVFIKKRTVQ